MQNTFQANRRSVGSAGMKILENLPVTFLEARNLAYEAGGRLPTLKEFIRELAKPELLKQFSEGVFWIEDESELSISGRCRINYEKGTLEQVSERNWYKVIPIEECARVWERTKQMTARVNNDGFGVRLLINDIVNRNPLARVIVDVFAEAKRKSAHALEALRRANKNTKKADGIMENHSTAQAGLRKIVKIFISDRYVTVGEIASAIPKDCRQATLEEVALRYRHDIKFRKTLEGAGWILTSQKKLESSGCHKISEDGKFLKIDGDGFGLLSQEEKAYHMPGGNFVAVAIANFESYWGLMVSANFGYSQSMKVAFVLDPGVEAMRKSRSALGALRRANKE